MSEKIKTAVMEVIKAHMDGEDKNTKAVLSDVMESVRETLEQEPCDECRNKRTSFCGNCNEYDEFEPCDDTISRSDMFDAIGHGTTYTSEELQRIIQNLPPVTQKSGKWIPVSERLPEDYNAVNITWVNHNPEAYYADIKDKPFVATAHYHNGKWFWFSVVCEDYLMEYGQCDCDVMGEDIEVIAWMPLPEPYEPQESEESDG